MGGRGRRRGSLIERGVGLALLRWGDCGRFVVGRASAGSVVVEEKVLQGPVRGYLRGVIEFLLFVSLSDCPAA